MATIDTNIIAVRRNAVDAEILKHQREIDTLRDALARLEAKRNELDIAARVISELSEENALTVVVANTPFKLEIDKPKLQPEDGSGRPKKPEGLPTVSEMIIEALDHARVSGGGGYKPAQITEYVRTHHWRDAPSEAITPIVWRLWKKDRKIAKAGAAYFTLAKPGELPEREIDNSETETAAHKNNENDSDVGKLPTEIINLLESHLSISSKEAFSQPSRVLQSDTSAIALAQHLESNKGPHQD